MRLIGIFFPLGVRNHMIGSPHPLQSESSSHTYPDAFSSSHVRGNGIVVLPVHRNPALVDFD